MVAGRHDVHCGPSWETWSGSIEQLSPIYLWESSGVHSVQSITCNGAQHDFSHHGNSLPS